MVMNVSIDGRVVTLEKATPVLFSPACRSLKLSHFSGYFNGEPCTIPPPNSSNIVSISLPATTATESVLSDLIKACKALETFTCCRHRNPASFLTWSGSLLLDLEKHSNTLESLELLSVVGWAWNGFQTIPPSKRPLANMTALKHLTIDYSAMVHPKSDGTPLADMLPPQLETLTIHFDRIDMADNIDYTTIMKSLLAVPALKIVHVFYRHDCKKRSTIPLLLYTLSEAFRKKGKAFQYVIQGPIDCHGNPG
jgi:hypothetical protein